MDLLCETSWETWHLCFREFDVSRFGWKFVELTYWLRGNQFIRLMLTGGLCSSKRLPLRLVAGVWCLAAFIFVQSYTSILFTYVVAPVNQPLINSVYDIVDRNDIQLLIRKGSTLNLLISVGHLFFIWFLKYHEWLHRKIFFVKKRIPMRLKYF